MRVVCDNCGATYKIPEHKLSREVNKATCRKCGHTIIIRRPGSGGPSVSTQPPLVRPDSDSTQISSEAELRARAAVTSPPPAAEEYVPPTVIQSQAPSHSDQTMPRADVRPPTPQHPAPPPMAPRPPSQAPTIVTQQPAPVAGVPLPQPKAFDPSGDLTLVMAGCFAAIIGASVMAANLGPMVTLIGLGLTLAASITSLMVLITGDRGRKASSMLVSMLLGLLLSGGATGGLLFSGLLETEPTLDPALASATPAPERETYLTLEHQDPDPVPAEMEPDAEPATETATETTTETPPKVEPPKTATVERVEPKPQVTKTQTDPPRVEPKRIEPKVEPKPTTSPTGTRIVGVPVTVLDTMLKSNKGVKTCFGKYRQETGSLPSGRITVRITVQPTGKATSARIAGGAYANTSLDSCLGGAIKSIQFPPWDGNDAATYNYPFIL